MVLSISLSCNLLFQSAAIVPETQVRSVDVSQDVKTTGGADAVVSGSSCDAVDIPVDDDIADYMCNVSVPEEQVSKSVC